MHNSQSQPQASVIDGTIPFKELEIKNSKSFRQLVSTTRVLLAEDCPDTRMFISHMLENIGLEVESVENGLECVEHTLLADSMNEPFDIILLDLQMPVLDGFGAASMLRWRGFPGVIVAMTAHMRENDKNEFNNAVCDYFLEKQDIHVFLPEIISECFYF